MIPTPLARRTDPGTSHAAAASATRKAEQCREHVRTILDRHPEGLTLADLVELHAAAVRVHAWPAYSPSGIRSRCAELVDSGEVVDTGRRTKMPSGRRAIVWALAPAATASHAA